MTAPDIKTFKLRARGDHGAGKSELLKAFARYCQQFGMTAELSDTDHALTVTATKEQRNRLYQANRKRDGA